MILDRFRLSCQFQLNGSVSYEAFSSYGSPQGSILSPLLYILYTGNCRSQHTGQHILKLADDTVIANQLQGEDDSPAQVVEDFIVSCDNTYLKLNVTKTKDFSIDFRNIFCPVQFYKCLACVIENIT